MKGGSRKKFLALKLIGKKMSQAACSELSLDWGESGQGPHNPLVRLRFSFRLL